MKKILLPTIVLSLFALGGCDLERKYLNGPDTSTFPASKAEVEAGVLATYDALANFNISSTPFTGLEDNTTDIGVSRVNTAYYNDQFKSKVALNNVVVTRYYKNFFVTIGRCNLMLDGLESQRSNMTEEEYNAYKAELIVMRGYVQDLMCQFWGDIPYIDHTLGMNATYTREPRAEVTAKILECMNDELLDYLLGKEGLRLGAYRQSMRIRHQGAHLPQLGHVRQGCRVCRQGSDACPGGRLQPRTLQQCILRCKPRRG